MKRIYAVAFAIASLFTVVQAEATTYKFTVVCQTTGRHVETWETGTIDPGREYLRVVSGTSNPNCSVGDFNPGTDSALPQNRHSDAGGVIEGLPPVVVIRKIFGF